MNLKKLLKTIKLNESSISMLLGALVIVVLGVLLVNYFQGRDLAGILPFPNSNQTESTPTPETLTHVVSEGESLWSIAEDYYGSGYNWVDIAQENNITDANSLEAGQMLVIPSVEERTATDSNDREEEMTNGEVAVETEQDEELPEEERTTDSISTDTYTVVRGDNLWNIAVRAYGDGYRWVEIAEVNELANPDLIHSGNVLVLPR